MNDTSTPLPMFMPFEKFLYGVRGKDFVPPDIIVALDPGETTGYALFIQGKLHATRQIRTPTVRIFAEVFKSLHNFATLSPHESTKLNPAWQPFDKPYGRPDVVVYEDYKIYSWKSDHHAWASLHTPQCLGALKAIATIHQLPLYTQLAQQPKGFCTDAKLKMWGNKYYQANQKHARDAVRHGCYYLLHNYKPDSNPNFAAQGVGDPKHYNGNP